MGNNVECSLLYLQPLSYNQTIEAMTLKRLMILELPRLRRHCIMRLKICGFVVRLVQIMAANVIRGFIRIMRAN
jgi:hypothetical protein